MLHVANSTISGNSAGSGGGIYNDGGADGGINGEISNTILNAGASGENIVNNNGLFNSLGYNLSSDDGGGYLNGPGDQINTDPLLGPLQDNSGPTFTHALLPGSPAINQGDPNFTPPPSYDQRGPNFYRVRDLNIDIGSFEVQAGFGPRQRPTPRPRPTPH
ncbi:MAG TPA: choice-of-anchor Q domain-containing protein [Candidatus Udaeobacter sp.]|nr:choice-of-anchor Q domain-containing protein [Candidatus Udaeobacter sp.]